MRRKSLTSTMLIVLAAMLVFAATVPAVVSVRVLVGFRDEVGKAEKAVVENAGGKIDHAFRIVNVIAARVPQANIAKLQANRNVVYVEKDLEVEALGELDNSWGVDRIDAEEVHDTNTGTGVKVAIIDTGIDYKHEDLDGNYMGGTDIGDGDDNPMDDSAIAGHGTFVAGIVAAEGNGTGVIGVAPEAYLYGVKVFDSDGIAYDSDVIAGIEWSKNNGMQVSDIRWDF